MCVRRIFRLSSGASACTAATRRCVCAHALRAPPSPSSRLAAHPARRRYACYLSTALRAPSRVLQQSPADLHALRSVLARTCLRHVGNRLDPRCGRRQSRGLLRHFNRRTQRWPYQDGGALRSSPVIDHACPRTPPRATHLHESTAAQCTVTAPACVLAALRGRRSTHCGQLQANVHG